MNSRMHLVRAFIFGILLAFLLIPTAVFGIVVPEGWKEVGYFVETAPEPIPNQVDRISGFIPFRRNYMEPIYTNSRPKKDEITDSFRVTLAKGEYEPFILALYALKNLDNIKVKLHNIRSKDAEISNDQIEVRRIEYRAVLPKGRRRGAKRYKLIPSLLKLASSADLKKGKTTAFWITVHALKKDVPGNYKGRIVISRNGKTIRTLKLDVIILPFVLEEIPDKTFAALYTPCSLSPEMERNARILLRDMRAHGMTSYSPIVSAWGKPMTFDKKGIPKVSNLVHHLQWAEEEGFRAPTLLNIQKLIRAGRPNLDANYTKFDKNVDIPNLKRLVLFLEEQRKENKWPEIIYIPIDEPGCFTDQAGTKREEMGVLLLKALKELNVRGATTVADPVDNKHRKLPRWKKVVGWWERMRPYCNVRIYANGYPEGKTSLANEIKDSNARGHEVMLYENSSAMGINPTISRMYFGFYGWRTGAKGITSWTHPLLGNATVHHVWADWKERRKDRLSYFRDKSWELPPSTICWEMVREGIDDAKYLHLLQKANEQKKSKKYEDLLNELISAIDSTKMSSKKAQCDWNGDRFSFFRQKIIHGLLELN